jgi:hypothetical protein
MNKRGSKGRRKIKVEGSKEKRKSKDKGRKIKGWGRNTKTK